MKIDGKPLLMPAEGAQHMGPPMEAQIGTSTCGPHIEAQQGAQHGATYGSAEGAQRMWAGPSTGGLIWKRRGDPARTGLAPEPYRYFAAGACTGTSNNSSLQLVCHTSNISNHKLAFTPAAGVSHRQYIQSQDGVHAGVRREHTCKHVVRRH